MAREIGKMGSERESREKLKEGREGLRLSVAVVFNFCMRRGGAGAPPWRGTEPWLKAILNPKYVARPLPRETCDGGSRA